MESILGPILTKLALNGVGFSVAVIMFILYWTERKTTRELTEKVISLAKESIAADMKNAQAHDALQQVYNLGQETVEINTANVHMLKLLSDKLDILLKVR